MESRDWDKVQSQVGCFNKCRFECYSISSDFVFPTSPLYLQLLYPFLEEGKKVHFLKSYLSRYDCFTWILYAPENPEIFCCFIWVRMTFKKIYGAFSWFPVWFQTICYFFSRQTWKVSPDFTTWARCCLHTRFVWVFLVIKEIKVLRCLSPLMLITCVNSPPPGHICPKLLKDLSILPIWGCGRGQLEVRALTHTFQEQPLRVDMWVMWVQVTVWSHPPSVGWHEGDVGAVVLLEATHPLWVDK